VEKLTDQAVLGKIAGEAKGLELRVAAIVRLTNTGLSYHWSEKDPLSAILQAAVKRIAGDRLLILLYIIFVLYRMTIRKKI
jgi:hypothetical protein